MATEKELEKFLSEVEKNAYYRAFYSIRNEENALDIVQESMLKLIENYHNKPINELLFLFQKILTNNINDWFRKQNTSIIKLLNDFDINEENKDNFTDYIDIDNLQDSTFQNKNANEILLKIDKSLEQLSLRQKEAFFLRYVEDFSITETAEIMQCSEGSVKTHCSRAVAFLSKRLNEQGISLNNL